jgi:hypothetical protein
MTHYCFNPPFSFSQDHQLVSPPLIHRTCAKSPAYRYDSGIPSVMLVAGGCLSRKKGVGCLAVLAQCLAVFVDFFHFLLFLIICFTGRKFWKLLFTTERGKVCYFLLLFILLVTLINYFLLCQEGQGLNCIPCATRANNKCSQSSPTVISPSFFFYC